MNKKKFDSLSLRNFSPKSVKEKKNIFATNSKINNQMIDVLK